MKVFLTTHDSAATHRAAFHHIAVPLVEHPRGWKDLDVVADVRDADSVVMLTPGDVLAEKFPQFADERLSVCNMNTREVWINEDRWLRNIPDKSQLPLPAYRAYVLQHELGHALGFGHANTGPGPTPVMVQQTLGLGAGTPNPFPTEEERNR